jgi:hypothetical protein
MGGPISYEGTDTVVHKVYIYMYFVSCRYEEPVTDVAAVQRMRNTPEYDRKASVPVKAAPKDASCSRFQASSHPPSMPLGNQCFTSNSFRIRSYPDPG